MNKPRRRLISLGLIALLLLSATTASAWNVLSNVGFEELGTCLDGGRFLLADDQATSPTNYHMFANKLPSDTTTVGTVDFHLNDIYTTGSGNGTGDHYAHSGEVTATWWTTATVVVSDSLIYHFDRNPHTTSIGSPSVIVQNCHLSDLPLITTQPASQTVLTGHTGTLHVVASGTPTLSYEWYQGPLYNDSVVVGTNSDTLTTGVLTQTTSFWVRVSNSFGHDNSLTATLTLSSAIDTYLPLLMK